MQHFNFLLQRVSSNIIAPILGQYQGPGYVHWSLLEGAKWSAISIALWSASWNGAWTRGINFGGSWSYCLLAWHTQWGQILYNVAFLICLSNKIVHKMSQVLKPNWRRWPACLLVHWRSVKLKSKLPSHEFFQKTNFNFTTMIPEVDLFSFVFWKELKTQKTFQN